MKNEESVRKGEMTLECDAASLLLKTADMLGQRMHKNGNNYVVIFINYKTNVCFIFFFGSILDNCFLTGDHHSVAQ